MSRLTAPPARHLPALVAVPALLLLPALVWLLTAPSPQAFATTSERSGEDAVAFEYLLANRNDPFLPFINEQAATASADLNEIVEPNEPLTGMQLFEPGQLTLVAILQSGARGIAMVEDFTGKGYTLDEGTKIGRRGVVKEITGTNVIIEETAETRAGNKIVTEVVMALKKEGE